MSIWRWADGFDAVSPDARIELGEGDTPLVRSRRLGTGAGLDNLYFKLESCNPTGSYKDRFAFSAISHMVARGERLCVATSSGNTGSALAAYCAAAGIRCNIAVVDTTPAGKLQQMLAYGANLYRIRHFGTNPEVTKQVFQALQRLGERRDTAMQVSAFRYSPLGMSGVRTLGMELAQESPQPIDHVFTPAGGGGLTVAVIEGFQHMVKREQLSRCPRVECVQPHGNNTIAGPLRDGAKRAQDVLCSTQISGLQVATVVDGHDTIRKCSETGGTGHLVSDESIWETQQRLAREEGIFCEPAGATATAGALQAVRDGLVDPRAVVVALVTGIGFKDPGSVESMVRHCPCPIIEVNELEDHAGA